MRAHPLDGYPERLQALLEECVQCLVARDVAAAEGVCAVLPALLLGCLDLHVADAAMQERVLEALNNTVQSHDLPGVCMSPFQLIQNLCVDLNIAFICRALSPCHMMTSTCHSSCRLSQEWAFSIPYLGFNFWLFSRQVRWWVQRLRQWAASWPACSAAERSQTCRQRWHRPHRCCWRLSRRHQEWLGAPLPGLASLQGLPHCWA